MKPAAFPPGPYEVRQRRTKRLSWDLISSDGRILTTSTTIIPEDEIAALGKLLAEAPAMFEVIQKLLAEGRSYSDETWYALKRVWQDAGGGA